MSWAVNLEVLALGVASLSFIIVLVLSFGAGIRYQISYDRLPAATRLQELEVLVGGEEARLLDIREQLKSAEVALSHRDQAEAEAEFWRGAAQTAKAEFEALADQRREIEENREKYRQAVEELTLGETQLRELKAAAEEATGLTKAAEERLKQIAREEETLQSSQSALRDAVSGLEIQLASLKEEKTALAVEVERMRERRLALLAEGETLDASIARLNSEREKAEATIAGLREAIAGLSAKRAEIEEVQQLLDESARKLDVLERSIEEKTRQENRLETQIVGLEEACLHAQERAAQAQAAVPGAEEKLRDLTNERNTARTDLAALQERLQSLAEHEAEFSIKIRAMEARHALLMKDTDQTPGGDASDDAVIADLTTPPNCLEGLRVRCPDTSEDNALDRVRDHLQSLNLLFSDRVLKAFHTSLKTATISPLTVLAGISGTGKSQLPYRYAEALGMHFLKLPVQPRWDSPQDMLGFYNYMEKRYKATDLARALVHLDEYNWNEIAQPFNHHMLLVLLDEMNLARVEYYFSEFLSRLEGRPGPNVDAPSQRKAAEIDLDLGMHGKLARRLYPSHRVLFVGTMNEDESTQTLSDKVLDRANLIRFSRPIVLQNEQPQGTGIPADRYLAFEQWIRWQKTIDQRPDNISSETQRWIATLNDQLAPLGRSFGHRVNQAFLAYVANYPGSHQIAFADQVEQRILPKLRGIEVNETTQLHLDRIIELVDSELRNSYLAEGMKKGVAESQNQGRPFVWSGVQRPE